MERYRLVRTVASGGMAQVVEAVACGLDGFERRVAIKRLLPQHVHDGERRRMFFEEARIGSRLHHGSIVPIFDYGLIDGSEFLAMDYVDGLDALRAVTGPGSDIAPMPEGIALHLVAEVAHALAYVHGLCDDDSRSLGIVHRDVSPANILLSWDGDVKLCDFGIAFSGIRRPEEQTIGGAIKGKLQYMAPEQARGERVSPAADVYALGATLDALLGGGALAPVSSDTSGDARAAEARGRGISTPASALIRACLSRDPERRPKAVEVAARAGALASRQLARDGRSALVEWLQPLRAQTLRRSKLDDLMGLCLVPVGPPEARNLTVSSLPDGSRASARKTRTTLGRPPATSSLVLSSVLIVAAVAVGLGAGRFINQLRSKGALAAPLPEMEPAPTSAQVAPVMSPTANNQLASEEPLHPAPAPVPPADPAAPAAGPCTDEGARNEGARNEGVRPHHPAAPERQAPDRQAPERQGRGWLRVGGATLAGARVTIDHLNAGFAPLEVELPAGTHNVTVNAPGSGRVLLQKTVRISEDRTRLAPVRVLR